jgi:hypothetical protein
LTIAISVRGVFSSHVQVNSCRVDVIAWFNCDGVLVDRYLVGNGLISAAAYSTLHDVTPFGREVALLLALFPAPAGSFLLIRKGSTKRAKLSSFSPRRFPSQNCVWRDDLFRVDMG